MDGRRGKDTLYLFSRTGDNGTGQTVTGICEDDIKLVHKLLELADSYCFFRSLFGGVNTHSTRVSSKVISSASHIITAAFIAHAIIASAHAVIQTKIAATFTTGIIPALGINSADSRRIILVSTRSILRCNAVNVG